MNESLFKRWWLKYSYRMLASTFRYVPVNQEIPNSLIRSGIPYFSAFLHEEFVSVAPSIRCYPKEARPVALTSMSKDGDVIEYICSSYGIDTVRGSSSRGGLKAMREIKQRAESGENNLFVIAVDGPRGPVRVVKQGIIYLASLLQMPIVTCRFLANPVTITYRAWDAQKIPFPLAKIYVQYGEPYYVPHRDEGMDIEKECALLAKKLNSLDVTREALRSGKIK